MKRIFTLACLSIAATSLLPSLALAENWISVCRSEYYLDNYYDRDSLKHQPNGVVTVMTKTVALDQKGRDALNQLGLGLCAMMESLKNIERKNKGWATYSKELVEFRCASGEHRVLSTTYYDGNHNVLCVFSDKAEFRTLPKDNCLWNVKQAVCR